MSNLLEHVQTEYSMSVDDLLWLIDSIATSTELYTDQVCALLCEGRLQARITRHNGDISAIIMISNPTEELIGKFSNWGSGLTEKGDDWVSFHEFESFEHFLASYQDGYHIRTFNGGLN